MLTETHHTEISGSRRGFVVRSATLLGLLLTASCGNAKPVDAPEQPPAATAQDCTVTIPALSGRVTDLADLITLEREVALSSQLAALEGKTGAQLVVVSVTSLNGRMIDEFSLCHASHWGIGRKTHDDGVILLVAPNERKVRIEVGYGLEETLTDGEAQRVLSEDVIPRFRDQDYQGGIEAGVAAIIKEIG